MRELLLVLLVLACPLAMFLMMRGGHGHSHGHAGHGRHHRHAGETNGHGALCTDDLRAQRDELDRLIAEREDRPELQETGAAR